MIISIADKCFLLSPPFLFFYSPPLCHLLDVRAAREQIHMGGVTYPTLPLQEAVPRPQSGYGQPPSACSPAGSFTGSLPPQPHSAYFSGMTGPQHPFYNRVRQNRDSRVDNLVFYLLFRVHLVPSKNKITVCQGHKITCRFTFAAKLETASVTWGTHRDPHNHKQPRVYLLRSSVIIV